MPLTPGTKLGQYEVVEAIGAGGMGEVYRARDTKLGRDVAIKVLPEEFSQDKERLDRFERDHDSQILCRRSTVKFCNQAAFGTQSPSFRRTNPA